MTAPHLNSTADLTAKNKKPASSSVDLSHTQNVNIITKNILNQYFPTLASVSGASTYIMAMFYMESSWQVEFKHAGGVVNSRGYTESPNRAFLNDPRVRAFTAAHLGDATAIENLKDANWMHSIGQCSGYYLLSGHAEGDRIAKLYPKVIADFGLQVPLGQSVTALFKAANSIQRGVASGLMILDMKYQARLKKGQPAGYTTLQEAAGDYLGGRGNVDNQGTTPEGRIARLNNGTDQAYILLAQAGITYTTRTVNTASTSGSGTATVPASGVQSASTSQPAQPYAGCSVA